MSVANNNHDMTSEEIRAVLLAKIEAAWPKYKDDPTLVESIELGSNDELRRHLAWAEMMRDTVPEEPKEWVEPSPRIPADEASLIRHTLSIRNGVELPPYCYVLARDEFMAYVGPAWVPFNLWGQFKYEGQGSVICECARKLIETPGAEELWGAIAKRFPRPDQISASLAVVCADALGSWKLLPRDTPSAFKDGREELARRAEQLAIELERFFWPRDADEHEWPGLLNFTQLMTQVELDRLDQGIRVATASIVNRARKDAGMRGMDWGEYNDIGSEARALGYQNEHPYRVDYARTPARIDAFAVYEVLLPDHTRPDLHYDGVPNLPDMLRRIAAKFRDDGDVPPLARPNLANAERNFFTRSLCKYFWTGFGDVSPALVRDIVSIFYPQGITENDVSQVAARVKRDHPLPADPETSGLK